MSGTAYQFRRENRGGALYIFRKGEWRSAPPVIMTCGYEGWNPFYDSHFAAVTAMLMDWLVGEQDAECKAAALARLVANRLRWKTSWRGGWSLTDSELASLVTKCMTHCYEVAQDMAEHVVEVEIVSAARRDILRGSLSGYSCGKC